MTVKSIKRALISVSDKTGIVAFAKTLHKQGIDIISTGGTCKLLQDANIPAKQVSDITDFPEIMDGRVKTLHPKIHAGILGKRDQHTAIAAQHQIDWIDLVVVNLYPFKEITSEQGVDFDTAIENIDIGGPTMIRAAAKNMNDVTVIVDPADYDAIATDLKAHSGIDTLKRQQLSTKAFAHTAQYDAWIHRYLSAQQTESQFPASPTIALSSACELRYGENPHQKAMAYRLDDKQNDLLNAPQHQGKALSYNNIVDAHAAVDCASTFREPACVIVKHANPCGVATADTISHAYQRALEADSTSAFGGIIALNRTCDEQTASLISELFFEVVVAPGFEPSALAQLAKKPNVRVIEYPIEQQSHHSIHYQFLGNLVLAQDIDSQTINLNELNIVTERTPSKEELINMMFAWRVVKHVKSNAIVLSKDNQTIGIGPGQVSRVDAVDIAIKKAGDKVNQSALASDAFFPFKDSIDHIAKANISAIIQPGGSIRDQEVIDACNLHGITMVFTGTRCFNH
jgi:phosphoribosylaminoimidazolecarboxamide formyltransferase / IMP cyclohydrolase